MRRSGRIDKKKPISSAHKKLYNAAKCREFSVMVTKMDFSKILGNFSKVKIKFDNNLSKKSVPKNVEMSYTNTRLKKNENGMVLIPRKAYHEHPVREIINSRNLSKQKSVKPSISVKTYKGKVYKNQSKTQYNNDNAANKKRNSKTTENPSKTFKKPLSLMDLWPNIQESFLPDQNWFIDYLPHSKNDVFDKVAAELEDLMRNEKDKLESLKGDKVNGNDVDDITAILDILNDNTDKQQQANDFVKTDLKKSVDKDLGSPSILSENESSKPSSPSKNNNLKKNVILLRTPTGANQEKPLTITQAKFTYYKNDTLSKCVTVYPKLNYAIMIDGKIVDLLAAPKSILSLDHLKILLDIVHITELKSNYVSY